MNDTGIHIVSGGSGTKKKRRAVAMHGGKIVIYIILVIFSLWILLPFLTIIVTSFTPAQEYIDATGYIWWPQHPSLDGYKRLFLDDPYAVGGIPSLLRGFFNTMWMTLIPLISSLVSSLLVAYCYSKWDFPCKNALFLLTVALMFIPLGAFGFVSYMFYQNIGWTEGKLAVLPLVVPGMFPGVSLVFFLRPYVDGIGNEIVEAAKIDGMGFWQIFFTIILPLSKPALVAQFIFGFAAGYNNYTGALLYLNNASEDMWTLQISLQRLIAYLSGAGDYDFMCATALMAMLPLIVLYICCQKFFIEGITFGGGKE